MGDKPVGLATLIGSLLCITLLFSAGFAWDMYGIGSTSHVAKIIFFISLGLIPLAIGWHFFGPRIDRDVYPDILGELFTDSAIMQMDDCHIVVLPTKLPGGIQFVVCIQNRFDHKLNVSFAIDPVTTWQFPNRNPPPLKLEVSPSEVVVAYIWRHFEKIDQDKWYKGRVKGNTKRHQKGRQIRFARRAVLRTEIPSWMTVVGLLGGALYLGGHREIKMRWQASERMSDVPDDQNWTVDRIWTPKENQSFEQIVEQIKRFQEYPILTKKLP